MAAIRKIAGHLRRLKPHVVITFGPDGAYGHPDHIAISQLTTAAIACAADPSFDCEPNVEAPHRVSKLYFVAWSAGKWSAYQAALKKLVANVDGASSGRSCRGREWAITTWFSTPRRCGRRCGAPCTCHKTQMSIYRKFETLPVEHQRSLWGSQEFYRVFSTVNGGRVRESDVFEGLR